ncbi:MAG: hypothetical protein AB7P21_10745 [Lautropia sp.]
MNKHTDFSFARSTRARAQRRRPVAAAMSCVALGALLAGCAGLDDGPLPRMESRPPAPMPGGQGPAPLSAGGASGGIGASGGGSAGPRAASPSGGRAADPAPVASKAGAAPDWVAVYESPRDAPYGEQRVIYVDRQNVETRQLEGLTYYLARTREVKRTTSKAAIQELAVICEGTPLAPATSLRGEGTEEGNGSYSIRPARGALDSLSQFSTQRIRIDPKNPTTFVVRAICMLGMERKG